MPTPQRSVQALDGMEAVGREQWDRLVVPGQGPLSHGFLSAWERVTLQGLRPRPLMAFDGDGEAPVAAAPACFYDLDPTCLKRGAPPLPVRALRRLREEMLFVRVYELGAPAALAAPLLHEPGMTPSDAARLLLPEAMAEARRGGAHVIVVQDFPAAGGGFDDVLEEAGFVPVPVLPTVLLDLPFASFEDYLARMRSPYRRRAHRVLDQSRELRVEHHHVFAPLAPELARLARAVFDRAGEIRREILSEEYFRRASAAPDLSLLVLRRADDSIACFALLLDDRPCLHFLNCGFELDLSRGDGAYFRLLYELVRTGIENRYERLNLGITTLPPKLDIGGVPVPLVAWIRYHRSTVQALCATAARRFLHQEVESPRRVFKAPLVTDP
ncbi:MAG TPA: GNAT family N-acetyltransferase, partial [Solirubrobacteraceae bacterium]|nr:GNAT family N-acetyltransferase [Solirubrobacteraceae bacterium]